MPSWGFGENSQIQQSESSQEYLHVQQKAIEKYELQTDGVSLQYVL